MLFSRSKVVSKPEEKASSLDSKFVKVDKPPSVLPPGPQLTKPKAKKKGGKKEARVVKVHMSRLSGRPPSGSFLQQWLAKHGSSAPTEDSVALASSFVDANTIYEFRLSRYFAKSTSVGGVLDDYFDNNPGSYSEWSALTSLFSMVKIRRSMARFARAYQNAVGTTVAVGAFRPMVININFDDIGAPGSYAGALDSPKNKVWNYVFDTSPLPQVLTLDFVGEHEPLWADVTTPSSSTLYQGCPGCCQMYVDTATASIEVIGIVQDLYILMMNRY